MSEASWWTVVLLGLAGWRTFRLLSFDTILDGPRYAFLGLRGWKMGQPTPSSYRTRLAEFLICSWCFGAWVGIGWWVAWQMWPHGTLVAAVPFAISAVIGVLSQFLDEE